MDAIKEEVEQMILELILFGQNLKDFNSPNDILDKLRYDGVEEIKDRLWDIITPQLDYKAIFEEIEAHKEPEDEDEEEENAESSESDSD